MKGEGYTKLIALNRNKGDNILAEGEALGFIYREMKINCNDVFHLYKRLF